MSICVVTSFSPSGYDQCGRNCVETFRKHWPKEVFMRAYHEGAAPEGLDGVDCIDLLDTEPCRAFLERHKDNSIVKGQEPAPGHAWRPNHLVARKNFRYDAYKFSRKVFAIAHAARAVKRGRLFWMDADIQTHRDVPAEFLLEVLPDDAPICHLARPGYHSECGFVGYNLDHEETRRLIIDFEHVYAADLFLKYKEWHDSFLFDRLIEEAKIRTHQIPHSYNPTPVEFSPLGKYLIHFKGARKDSQQAMDHHRRAVRA